MAPPKPPGLGVGRGAGRAAGGAVGRAADGAGGRAVGIVDGRAGIVLGVPGRAPAPAPTPGAPGVPGRVPGAGIVVGVGGRGFTPPPFGAPVAAPHPPWGGWATAPAGRCVGTFDGFHLAGRLGPMSLPTLLPT